MLITCPYCKEKIQAEAIKCRHCSSDLREESNPKTPPWGDSVSIIKNALKDQFEVYELLGKGGMASVYKAKQKKLDRIVALKIIHPHLVSDHEFVQRFLREAQLSASLSHPNIVRIYDFGEAEGIYYISMEYLDGADLSSLIRTNQHLEPDLTIRYLIPVADALVYLHNKGLLHRDVKSANIFITAEGRPVLTDFGIAHSKTLKQMTVAGSLLGTPEYLSPEQAAGGSALPESDFYCLGVVMYECLTGQVPFTNPNPIIVVNNVIKTEPRPIRDVSSNIPANIEKVVMGLLRKKPEKRTPYIESLFALWEANVSSYVMPSGKWPIAAKRKRKSTSQGQNKIKILPSKNKLVPLLLTIVLAVILTWIVIIARDPGNMVLQNGNVSNIQPPPSPSTNIISEANEKSTQKEEEVLSPSQTTSPSIETYSIPNEHLAAAIELIQSQVVEFGEFYLMKNPVSNRIWNLVIQKEHRGNHRPVTGLSFQQVQLFINELNNSGGHDHRFYLPTFNTLKEARSRSALNHANSGIREWVSDPVTSGNQVISDYASYYHSGFDTPSGWVKTKVHERVVFRLAITY